MQTRRGIPLCFSVVVVACGLVSCRRAGDTPASNESTIDQQSAEEQLRADIDRLRSLGYAGVVEREDGEKADQESVVLHVRERSYPGYNLYSVFKLCAAELIDAEGDTVRWWSHRGHNWVNVKLLPNGDLLALGAEEPWAPNELPTNNDRYLLRFNWEGELLWKRKISVHHDIERTPDGQLLTLTFQPRRIPEIHPRFDTRGDHFTLVSNEGAVLDSFSLYEVLHAKPEVFPLVKVGLHPKHQWVDVFHANSLEWAHHQHLVGRHPIYDLANVLVCFRHQNRVAVINWDKKEPVWAWGKGELDGPHDAQYLPNGNILVFDNGLGRGWSRVIEIDPIQKRIVWLYETPVPGDFYTRSKGSSQRLPNGNTLIADSDSGRAIEVTPEGELVWEFLCPHRAPKGRRMAINRIRRYESAVIERLLEKSASVPRRPTTEPGRPPP